MIKLSWLPNLGQKSLSFLLPPRCLHCKDLVFAPHSLCATCWSQLIFISEPFCDKCGVPFDFTPSSSLCASCSSNAPPFEKGRSALLYNEISKALLLQFKHGDALHLTPFLGNLLLPLLPSLLSTQENTTLVPIPLHPIRLFKRQYNQAALLAHHLHKKTRIPYIPNALNRIKNSPSQGHLSPDQRHKNVQGAFKVEKDAYPLIRGKTLLLIDDVWTTGATLCTAAKTLLNAGAGSVFALTITRVYRI